MVLIIENKQHFPFNVYRIIITLGGQEFHYVGFTGNFEQRIREHSRDRRRPLFEAINKADNVVVKIVLGYDTKQEARLQEAALIKYLAKSKKVFLLNTHHAVNC